MTKTRKIQLLPTSDFNKTYDFLRIISSEITSLSNLVVRQHFMALNEVEDIKKTKNISRSEANKLFSEIHGMSIQNLGYCITKQYPNIPSDIRTNQNQLIFKKIENVWFDCLIGKESIPSFRKDKMPIPLSMKDKIKRTEIGNDEFSIIKGISFKLYYGRDKSNNKSIIDRILSGEYKACISQIILDGKKIFLSLTYQFEPIKTNHLDPNKIMGLDLGISRPVTIALNDGSPVYQTNIGDKIQAMRMSIGKQRKSIQKTTTYNKGGHGVKRKTKKSEELKENEFNAVNTCNHKISRYVINYCIKLGIGTIKMEDLTGITKDTSNYFLKSWPYYKLQEQIINKAIEVGIIILFVKSAYTSQTCPTCKNIDKNQRDKRVFKCLNESCEDFNIEKNADSVGALNISRADGTLEKLKSKKKQQKELQVSE